MNWSINSLELNEGREGQYWIDDDHWWRMLEAVYSKDVSGTLRSKTEEM